jgi:hypothetical protein
MYKMFFLIIILCYTITAQQTVIEEFSATDKGHTVETFYVGGPAPQYFNSSQNLVEHIWDSGNEAWQISKNIYQYDLSTLPNLNYVLSCSLKIKVQDTYGNVKVNISKLNDGSLPTSAVR